MVTLVAVQTPPGARQYMRFALLAFSRVCRLNLKVILSLDE